MAKTILENLGKPKEFVSRVVFAIESHMGPLGRKANGERFMTKNG